MESPISKLARRVARLFTPDGVRYEEAILPAEHLRYCGTEFRDTDYFLASARAEADRLVEHFGLTVGSRLLDVGCGVGRLPIGILSRIGELQHYRGVDVSKKSIRWCRRYISRRHPGFQFIHIDVKNPRYNPSGKTIGADFRLPFDNQEFDIIYLYSVFSHMAVEDVKAYLGEFERLLSHTGKMFFTAFAEDGVPDMTINPEDYRMKWTGELHCVRYNRDFLRSILAENGFDVKNFVYEKETDGQSAVYVSRIERNDT